MASASVPGAPDIVFARLGNFRDVGGAAARGGVLRHDVIWRSDDPSFAPAEEIAELVGRGLTTVVDLRHDVEREVTGSGFLADHDIVRVAIPIGTGYARHLPLIEQIRAGVPGFERLLGRYYAHQAAEDAEAIARVAEIVADGTGATLIHCTMGKDRTGLVTAALLALAGVADDDIVADYALTEANAERTMERIDVVIRARQPIDGPPQPRHRDAFEHARPETMRALLDFLRAEHGGYVELLRDSGVTPDIERRLHERVVDRLEEAAR